MQLNHRTIRLAACFFAAMGGSCQTPKGTAGGDQETARGLLEVRLEASKDAAPEEYDTISFQGKEYKFSPTAVIDACGITQIAVVRQLPDPSWSVAIELSNRSSELPTSDRGLGFGVFVEKKLLYAGDSSGWRSSDRLNITAGSADEAFRIAKELNRAWIASGPACSQDRAGLPVAKIERPPPHDMEPALECTPEAREAGLKGTLTIRIVVRRDGTVDPNHWEILKGDPTPLADWWMEHMVATWKFTPAKLRGEPRDSRLVLQVDYDCGKRP